MAAASRTAALAFVAVLLLAVASCQVESPCPVNLNVRNRLHPNGERQLPRSSNSNVHLPSARTCPALHLAPRSPEKQVHICRWEAKDQPPKSPRSPCCKMPSAAIVVLCRPCWLAPFTEGALQYIKCTDRDIAGPYSRLCEQFRWAATWISHRRSCSCLFQS